jgi:hypothetical protein
MQKMKIEFPNFADDAKNNLELIKRYTEELYRMAGRPLPAERLRKIYSEVLLDFDFY